MATKNSTETRTRSLVIRWGTSRGAETYGYTTCSASIDGKRLGACNGGGYDMQGTAIALAIVAEYGARLWPLHEQAAHAGVQIKGQEYQPIKRPDNPNGLYGLRVTYTNAERTAGKMSLDGACGIDSVRRVMKEIGLTIRQLHSDSRITVYELIDAA